MSLQEQSNIRRLQAKPDEHSLLECMKIIEWQHDSQAKAEQSQLGKSAVAVTNS